jgi:ankyrin repeat protein
MLPGYCCAGVNVQDNYHNTSLRLAVCFGHLHVARLLVEHGGNIDAEDIAGRTAFQVATERGYHEIAKLLSDHGSK